MTDWPTGGTAGQRLFARYAYAPSQLGYCGPEDPAALFELAATGESTGDLRAIAGRFTGAWPYLCVLAELAGIDDPLDERVVRAYWTGSALLDSVNPARFGRTLLDRITAAGAGRHWAHLTPALLPEAVPTHGFHVFGVYPWTRMLARDAPQREGPSQAALRVLDSCRIRWGRVEAVTDGHALIRGPRLSWDGRALRLGVDVTEIIALTGSSGHGFVTGVRPGDWLAVHWDWACDRLTAGELWQLRRWTGRQLLVTNTRLARESAGQPGGDGRPGAA